MSPEPAQTGLIACGQKDPAEAAGGAGSVTSLPCSGSVTPEEVVASWGSVSPSDKRKWPQVAPGMFKLLT